MVSSEVARLRADRHKARQKLKALKSSKNGDGPASARQMLDLVSEINMLTIRIEKSSEPATTFRPDYSSRMA